MQQGGGDQQDDQREGDQDRHVDQIHEDEPAKASEHIAHHHTGCPALQNINIQADGRRDQSDFHYSDHQKTKDEWVSILNDAGVPAARVRRLDESMAR